MLISCALDYVKELFANDFSGHDFSHTYRVYRTATRIAERENANIELVQLAAILHDVDDRKLSPETHAAKANAVRFMHDQNVAQDRIQTVCDIISAVSFSENRGRIPGTLEGKCVQDADRLDALGAIGIARTFAYGGSHGRPMHDPNIQPGSDPSTSLNHFYEKLFLLKDMMHTQTGREMAEKRDQFMHSYISVFMDEWDGIR